VVHSGSNFMWVAVEFEAFYHRNWHYVRALLSGLGVAARDLDDVGHEVFLVALQKPPEGALDAEHERFWLRQIGCYRAAGYRRRSFRRLEVGVEEPGALGAPVPNVEGAGTPETAELLDVMLSGLNADDSELLALHLVGELSFRHLGAICDCDPKTARKRFLAALRRARALTRDGEHPPGVSEATPWAAQSLAGSASGTFRISEHLDLRAFDECIAIGIAGRVVITHWYGEVTAATLDLLLRETRGIHDAGKGKFGYLAIVERSCRPPGIPERAKILELLRFFRNDLAAYATVQHANPFVFPIMSALVVLARVPFPFRLHASADSAAEWLCTTLRDGTGLPHAGALIHAAAALQSHWASRESAPGRAAPRAS